MPLVYELISVRKPLINKENNKNLSLFLNKENTLNDDYTFETFVEGKSNNWVLRPNDSAIAAHNLRLTLSCSSLTFSEKALLIKSTLLGSQVALQ